MISFIGRHWYLFVVAIPSLIAAGVLSYFHPQITADVTRYVLEGRILSPYDITANTAVFFSVLVAALLIGALVVKLLAYIANPSAREQLENNKSSPENVNLPPVHKMEHVIKVSSCPSNMYELFRGLLILGLMFVGSAYVIYKGLFEWFGYDDAGIWKSVGALAVYAAASFVVVKIVDSPIRGIRQKQLASMGLLDDSSGYIPLDGNEGLYYNTITNICAIQESTRLYVFPYRLLREWKSQELLKNRSIGGPKSEGGQVTLYFNDPEFAHKSFTTESYKTAHNFYSKLTAVSRKLRN